MSIFYTERSVKFESVVGIEEVDTLLEWLRDHPKGKLNLEKCTHVHAAGLQVLMVTRPKVSVWPADIELKQWLQPILA